MDLKELRKDFEYSYPFLAKNILDTYGSSGYTALLVFFLDKIKQVKVEPEVKVNFAERIIEEEIEKLEKLANEYNEDMDTEGYINNLNDSNILHRVLIRIKSESKISA